MTKAGEKRGLLPRLKGTNSKRQKKTSAGPSQPSTRKGGDQSAPLASTMGAPAAPIVPSLVVAPGPPVINIIDNSPDGVGSSCPPAEEARENTEPRESAPARELTPAGESGPARESVAPPVASSVGLVVAQPSGGGTFSIPRHLHPICKFLFDNISPQTFGSLPEPSLENLFLEAGMRMVQVKPCQGPL